MTGASPRAEAVDAALAAPATVAAPATSPAVPVPDETAPVPTTPVEGATPLAAALVDAGRPAESEAGVKPSHAAGVQDAKVYTDDGIHTEFYRRIAQIQNERQTRWQRVVAVLTGG